MPDSFEQQVAQAVMDIFNEWMRLGEQRPTWMIFISPRVATAIQVGIDAAEADENITGISPNRAALAALRGKSA